MQCNLQSMISSLEWKKHKGNQNKWIRSWSKLKQFFLQATNFPEVPASQLLLCNIYLDFLVNLFFLYWEVITVSSEKADWNGENLK